MLPQPPVVKRKRSKKWLLAAIPAFVLGLVIPTGGGTATVAAPAAQPTAYITATVSGPTSVVTQQAKPGPTETEPAKPAATVTVTKEAPAPAPAPQSDSLNALEIGGTLKVGEDVKPGAYKAHADENGNCYWARLKDSSGEDIIANDLTEGSTRLTIKRSDKYVQTSGCIDWKKA